MLFSSYQEAIFEFVRTGKGDAVVNAGPGSGKTTTIIQATTFIPSWQKTILLSFTTNIAGELKLRLEQLLSSAESATLNAFGWRICRENIRGVRLDKFKTGNLFKFYCRDNNIELDAATYAKTRGLISKIVSLMKAYVFEPQTMTDEMIKGLFHRQALTIPELKKLDVIEAIKEIYQQSVTLQTMMDFDDQKFMPAYYGWDCPQYDFVFIDEAQDLAPLDVALIKMMGGRKVFVGDDYQSIYMFRGADPASLDNIKKDFNAVELPLTICYRCPDVIIEEAKKINPNIEKPLNNPKGRGEIETITRQEFRQNAKPGNFVLSRTTAPLVTECLKMLPLRYCYVKGRDIGEGLFDLIDTVEPGNCPIWSFSEKFEIYYREQSERLLKLDKEYELSLLEDRVEGLKALVPRCNDVMALRRLIEEIIPSDEKGRADAVIFMSMHRAKGLETEEGFILYPLPPHPRAKTEDQLRQEDNLLFVAITRFQRKLSYVLEEKKR